MHALPASVLHRSITHSRALSLKAALGISGDLRQLSAVGGGREVGGHAAAFAGERGQIIRMRRVLFALKPAQV